MKIKQLPPSKSFSISPIPHHIPLAPTEEFDPADTEESVFQFSPGEVKFLMKFAFKISL